MGKAESPIQLEGSKGWQAASTDESAKASQKALFELSALPKSKRGNSASPPDVPGLSIETVPDAEKIVVGDPLHGAKPAETKLAPSRQFCSVLVSESQKKCKYVIISEK